MDTRTLTALVIALALALVALIFAAGCEHDARTPDDARTAGSRIERTDNERVWEYSQPPDQSGPNRSIGERGY